MATLPSLSPGYGSIANKLQSSVCYGKIPSSQRAAYSINPPAAGHTCSLLGLGSNSTSSHLLCHSWGQHPFIFFLYFYLFNVQSFCWKPGMKSAKMGSNLGQVTELSTHILKGSYVSVPCSCLKAQEPSIFNLMMNNKLHFRGSLAVCSRMLSSFLFFYFSTHPIS